MDFENFKKAVDAYNTNPENAEELVSRHLESIERIGRGDILKDQNIKIVDVGTWKGTCVQVLRNQGFNNAIGVEQNIELAKANPRLVIQGMAHELPFNDKTIDLITVTDMFSDPGCSKSPDYHKRVLIEFARVLKKNGIVSIIDCGIPHLIQISLDDETRLIFNILKNDENLGLIILEKIV